MADATRLLVILEEDNRIRLELPNGIPSSVDEVIQQIKSFCGLTNEIRLQYYDADFGTWVNLTSTSELKDLATLKVIHVEPTVTAKNIKKPRRAESIHYPSLPLNETPESMEQERIALLSEVKKRNNVKTIREKMAQTFAFRRQEIIDKKTSLLSIIERWPALLEVQEVH